MVFPSELIAAIASASSIRQPSMYSIVTVKEPDHQVVNGCSNLRGDGPTYGRDSSSNETRYEGCGRRQPERACSGRSMQSGEMIELEKHKHSVVNSARGNVERENKDGPSFRKLVSLHT
jgi:hypothetical protein